MRCQNDARAGPFGGVVPVQMAGAATAAQARRALALKIREADMQNAPMRKRQTAAAADQFGEEDEDEEEC